MSLNYVLRAKKFRAKKSLGQNFLVDFDTIDFISNLVSSDDEVLEIGPGLGFVTEQFVKKAKNVVAVEVDSDAISVLKENLKNFDNFHLIEKDILKTTFDELPFNTDKIKVVANIPYYITSPILFHLLGEIDEINHSFRNKISDITLMVQYEVAKRLVADENSKNKDYGKLSILAQMFSDVEIIKLVNKTCFLPSPKVDSALVHFKIKDKPKVEPSRLLKQTVSALFSTRRKNVKNSLLYGGFNGVVEALQKANISETIRGEKLSIYDIKKIALALEEFN